ncbi:NAD-dependent protein deacylase [Gorillibacterium timonense]|uniref:NAD-dependent protein deacylase n=1 Tax=Gorillibacterium timonense TaxID=1689269 RepID=UPI00071E4B6E|nr:NAD-dependent protein deacylase [Gorillibacterium timonense]
MESAEKLARIIQGAERIVFFGGAGTSTESGIPDFRSASGLYRTESGFEYPPETMLSRSFFDRHPDEFFAFYRAKMLHPDSKPSGAHRALARLEREGRLTGIITQNIDGLHQLAGSRRVVELHGSVLRNTCMNCGHKHPLSTVTGSSEIVPHCPACSGIIKPDVVLYEESLDLSTLEQAVQLLQEADLLMVGGTSLTVTPAAALVRYFRGNQLVLLNKTATAYDRAADLIIRDNMGEVLEVAVR